MTFQFWRFYWRLERERIHLSRVLPESITDVGEEIPREAQIIPVRTAQIDLLSFSSRGHREKEIPREISLRSLMNFSEYLVVNFGSCT